YWIIHKEDDISLELKEKLINEIKLELCPDKPDYVIVIGGDGTFISAVHQYPKAIFFGIHTGHLGFYANYTLEDVSKLIDDIHQQNFQIEKLDILECQLSHGEKNIHTFAMNEITIITPPKTLIAEIFIDKEKLETFRGTGLCISTPYGSTAYNKSLHGAVLDSTLKAFQITEIAGINSNSYRTLTSSLLLASNRLVKIKVEQPAEVFVTADHLSYHLIDFKEAQISLHLEKVAVALPKDIHFIERIKRTFL
ncbi:MAG: NAD kinase, partial [Anaeroplasmataceae bacterium]|nr:NAD kinase [Anaeroplasmataceae bacterium]